MFHVGQQVWLDGKNLQLQYPSAKLAPKQFRPLLIKEAIGSGAYCLGLPHQWKIHDVFHSPLLLPYQETEEHGPNFTRPPPDLIEGEEEYKVEAIIDAKQDKRFQAEEQICYLVKWKGYPDSENQWVALLALTHSADLIAKYHQKNPEKPRPMWTALQTAYLILQIAEITANKVQTHKAVQKHRPWHTGNTYLNYMDKFIKTCEEEERNLIC